MIYRYDKTTWKGIWNILVETSITYVWEAIYAKASTAVIAHVTPPTNTEPRSCLCGTRTEEEYFGRC